VEEKGRLVYTCCAAPGMPQPSYESIEAIGATIVRTARFLMDRNVSPCEVRLERPERPDSDRFETFFRCPVYYGADEYRMAFDASMADRLLPTRHADLSSVADRMTADYVERVQSSGRFADQVGEVVASVLADGEPTQRAVAAHLAMSCRTMQRRLQEESTTFRDVVADVRIAAAKQLMRSERMPTNLIALRLGFSDTAAFRRAFKRRTGMTAGEFSALTR
jgi:AraC-like DNA-binding protein